MQTNKLKHIFRLGFSMALAQTKLRNEGSYLGILWYLINPLSVFVIILFIKGKAFSTVHIDQYPLYLLFGLVIYNVVNRVVTNSITVIEKNGGIIKSIKIEPDVFIISGILQVMISHVSEIILLGVFMIYFHVSLIGLIWYIFLLFILTLFLFGVACIVATIGVYVSDLSNLWSVAAQLLFFASPIFYVVEPGSSLYVINLFNPLYYFLQLMRDAALYHTLDISLLITAVILSSLIAVLGYSIFLRHKGRFAELV
jgi:ABC-type polysaccharide/polyol phosphate export permease